MIDLRKGVITMAAKTAKKIELTVKQAQDLLTVYTNIEAADAHFKTCQADLFRDFTRDTIKAKDIESAYATLRQQIEAAQEGETNVR